MLDFIAVRNIFIQNGIDFEMIFGNSLEQNLEANYLDLSLLATTRGLALDQLVNSLMYALKTDTRIRRLNLGAIFNYASIETLQSIITVLHENRTLLSLELHITTNNNFNQANDFFTDLCLLPENIILPALTIHEIRTDTPETIRNGLEYFTTLLLSDTCRPQIYSLKVSSDRENRNKVKCAAISALAGHRHLLELDISSDISGNIIDRNPVNTRNITDLAIALTHNFTLQSINLGWLSPACIRILPEVLADNYTVQELRVHYAADPELDQFYNLTEIYLKRNLRIHAILGELKQVLGGIDFDNLFNEFQRLTADALDILPEQHIIIEGYRLFYIVAYSLHEEDHSAALALMGKSFVDPEFLQISRAILVGIIMSTKNRGYSEEERRYRYLLLAAVTRDMPESAEFKTAICALRQLHTAEDISTFHTPRVGDLSAADNMSSEEIAALLPRREVRRARRMFLGYQYPASVTEVMDDAVEAVAGSCTNKCSIM